MTRLKILNRTARACLSSKEEKTYACGLARVGSNLALFEQVVHVAGLPNADGPKGDVQM